MFTAPCQKLQMRLRRAQSSSSSKQREKAPAAAPRDSTGFYPLVNGRVAPRDGARVRGGDVTSPKKTRQHQAKTATPPPNAPHRVTFHSTKKLCEPPAAKLKAFYGHLAEAAANVSECNTRVPRVFSRASPACASASCWPLILRSQVSETSRLRSPGADAPNSGTGTITPGDTAGKVSCRLAIEIHCWP